MAGAHPVDRDLHVEPEERKARFVGQGGWHREGIRIVHRLAHH